MSKFASPAPWLLHYYLLKVVFILYLLEKELRTVKSRDKNDILMDVLCAERMWWLLLVPVIILMHCILSSEKTLLYYEIK